MIIKRFKNGNFNVRAEAAQVFCDYALMDIEGGGVKNEC